MNMARGVDVDAPMSFWYSTKNLISNDIFQVKFVLILSLIFCGDVQYENVYRVSKLWQSDKINISTHFPAMTINTSYQTGELGIEYNIRTSDIHEHKLSHCHKKLWNPLFLQSRRTLMHLLRNTVNNNKVDSWAGMSSDICKASGFLITTEPLGFVMTN